MPFTWEHWLLILLERLCTDQYNWQAFDIMNLCNVTQTLWHGVSDYNWIFAEIINFHKKQLQTMEHFHKMCCFLQPNISSWANNNCSWKNCLENYFTLFYFIFSCVVSEIKVQKWNWKSTVGFSTIDSRIILEMTSISEQFSFHC